jgi:hypothetical protein
MAMAAIARQQVWWAVYVCVAVLGTPSLARARRWLVGVGWCWSTCCCRAGRVLLLHGPLGLAHRLWAGRPPRRALPPTTRGQHQHARLLAVVGGRRTST